jgi:hypothetical protein
LKPAGARRIDLWSVDWSADVDDLLYVFRFGKIFISTRFR